MLVAGLIVVVCAIFVMQRSGVIGATSLLGVFWAVGIWCFAYAFELASAKLGWQIFWAKAQYLGIPYVSLFFFIFTYDFSKPSSRLARWKTALLLLPAVAFTLLAWTNESHGLIWSRIEQKDFGNFVLLSIDHGPIFWAVILYSYLLLIAGSVLIIRKIRSSPPELRAQFNVILLGAAVPWLGNALYITKLNPFPDLDLTPISFMVLGVFSVVGLFRYGLLDIMPIAGEAVLESLDDVVIVTNAKGMVIFINNAFRYFFRTAPASLVGRHASEAFLPWSQLASLAGQSNTIRKEITVSQPDTSFIFDTRIFNVRWNSNTTLGRVIMLRDVTERRMAENRVIRESIFSGGSLDLPMTVIYRTGDDRIIDVNRAFLLRMGFERKDVLGRSLIDIRAWDSAQRADFLRTLFREGSLSDHELQFFASNGEKIPCKLSASQMNVQGSKYIVLIGQEATAQG